MTILQTIGLGFGTALILGYGAYILPTPYYKLKNRFRRRNSEPRPASYNSMKSNPVASLIRPSILYLTFDDGPSHYTSILLDLLEDYDIQATFFVVGEQALNYPDVVKRMVSNGHTIGFHSDRHQNQLLEFPSVSRRDALSTAGKLATLGVHPVLFRPPWLQMNAVTAKVVRDHHWQVQLADVLIGDWKANETAQHLSDKLIHQVKPGDVICLHDGRGLNHAPLRTIQALKLALPTLLSAGYQFKTIEVPHD